MGPWGFQFTFSGIEAIKFLVTTNWKDFDAAGAWPLNFIELFGDDVVAFTDGEKHARLRRLLLPALRGPALKAYPPRMSATINAFISRWLAAGRVTLMPDLLQLTFQVAAALLVGGDAAAARPEIAARFQELSAGLVCLRLRHRWSAYGKALAARDALHALLDRVIDERAARSPEGAAPEDGDLLDRILGARGDDGESLGREEARRQALLLLWAGHDTTASLMSSAFYCLSRLPAAQLAALRSEQVAETTLGCLLPPKTIRGGRAACCRPARAASNTMRIPVNIPGARSSRRSECARMPLRSLP